MLFIILTIIFAGASVFFFLPWIRRKMECKAFRIALADKSRPLVHNYTDEDGNRWYIYKNVLDMGPRRAIAATIAAKQADLCFTTEFFDRVMEDVRFACSKGDIQTVMEKVGIISQRRTWAGEERTMQKLAHVYCILEGEDPNYTSEHWFDKKMAIWAKNDNVYAFFLKSAYERIRTLHELSATDFLDYLRAKAIEDLQMMELNYGKSSSTVSAK